VSTLQILRSRVVNTLIPALIGAAIGFSYARASLPKEVVENTALAAMYGSAGAIIVILGVRLSLMVRLLVKEARASKAAPEDEAADETDRTESEDSPR
jgi:hypothetical protein